MANDFQNAIFSAIGTARQDLYTTPSASGKRSMLIGLELANTSGGAITVDIEIFSVVVFLIIFENRSVHSLLKVL